MEVWSGPVGRYDFCALESVAAAGHLAGETVAGLVDNKSYDVADIRCEFNQAYIRWTEREDAYLRERFLAGATIAELVSEFGRQPGGIRSRLRKLGLAA